MFSEKVNQNSKDKSKRRFDLMPESEKDKIWVFSDDKNRRKTWNQIKTKQDNYSV